ncbi:MAG: hypothetical protein AAFZ92_04590 [Pseudomonadota bacterium]
MSKAMRLKPLFSLMLCSYLALAALPSHASEAEAAAAARAQTQGKVLQVKKAAGDQYRVKVLMPNGQVRTLSINTRKVKNN